MQQRIDPDEKVAGKKHFDGIDPLPAPAPPDPDARQVNMKILAQQVFFRNRFLARLAANGIPASSWLAVRGSLSGSTLGL